MVNSTQPRRLAKMRIGIIRVSPTAKTILSIDRDATTCMIPLTVGTLQAVAISRRIHPTNPQRKTPRTPATRRRCTRERSRPRRPPVLRHRADHDGRSTATPSRPPALLNQAPCEYWSPLERLARIPTPGLRIRDHRAGGTHKRSARDRVRNSTGVGIGVVGVPAPRFRGDRQPPSSSGHALNPTKRRLAITNPQSDPTKSASVVPPSGTEVTQFASTTGVVVASVPLSAELRSEVPPRWFHNRSSTINLNERNPA